MADARTFQAMNTKDLSALLAGIFSELTAGAQGGANFVLNGGDPGLLSALDGLSAAQASMAVQDGASVAAHAEHLRFSLSLMNRWATEGGNPFANAAWYQAWEVRAVDADRWAAIRAGLRKEVLAWQEVLHGPREVLPIELGGMLGSVVHLAYHLGAMRQVQPGMRGPKDASTR
jgi:hypothetical protein